MSRLAFKYIAFKSRAKAPFLFFGLPCTRSTNATRGIVKSLQNVTCFFFSGHPFCIFSEYTMSIKIFLLHYLTLSTTLSTRWFTDRFCGSYHLSE